MNHATTIQSENRHAIGLVWISFIAFISLGLPDGLLGVAWPGIRHHFNLPIDALGMVLVTGTAGYMLSSFFCGVLIRRLGVGGLLSLSCAATASALFAYASAPVWWLFIVFAAVGGLGAGAIDAGINTFAAKHHSTRMMQWLHASFGVGITLGPVIMTIGISVTSHWEIGYFLVSIAQGMLAVIFLFTKGMWEGMPLNHGDDHQADHEAPLTETIRKMHALLSVLMFFIYTGVELGVGLWACSLLTESRGIAPKAAGIITGGYWAMFTLGRILAGWYTSKIDPRSLIYISVSFAIIGIGILWLDFGQVMSILGIALAGFAVAPIFPSLVSDTESRVGPRHQANTIGMQIAAAGLGAALVPAIAGVLARIYGLEAIPFFLLIALILLLLCFVFSHFHSENHENSQR